MRTPNINSAFYAPGVVPRDSKALQRFLQDELKKIQNAVNAVALGHLDETHVSPAKPRTGDLRLADGTNWNPGSGRGLYIYFASTWNFVASSGTYSPPIAVNVVDYGAVGDGVAENTAEFQDAVTASDNVVIVPDGDFLLSSPLSATNKHFLLFGSVTGNGDFGNAIVTRFGGNVLAIGRNATNAGVNWQGLQIGGGDVTYGSGGVFLANDGNQAWLRFQPTANKSPIEIVIYTTSAQGTAQSAIGTNEITRLSGSSFEASDVGRFIYFGENVYIIASVVGNVVTVTNTGGGAVSFAATATEIWQIAYVQGSGTCNVNGTTITRVTGDPFIAFTSAVYSFKVNGTARTLSTFTDIDTVNITANLGVLTGVTYSFEAQINHQLATVRVQKLAGSDEENLSIYARYDGYWIQSQFAGSGSYRKIVIGSGESTSGTLGRQIVCQKNGDLCLGNDYNDDAIRILNQTPANSVNRFETQAAPTGSTPAWRSRGADTNVNFGIDTQGTGNVVFTSSSFTNRNFEIIAGGGASWLEVTSSSGTTPTLSADGSGADVDINLVPKGAGKVRLGNNNGTVDAPISGYIEVKDYSGNIIKLATIT